MTFKQRILKTTKQSLFSLFTIVLPLTSFHSVASESANNQRKVQFLNVNPERCVALRQGQICYQEIKFTWQALTPARLCLYDEESTTPIKCWKGKNKGSYSMDFQSSTSRSYILKNEDSKEKIAATKFIVAWVYGNKKRRRTSWRLF
jgi:hypothetical protein